MFVRYSGPAAIQIPAHRLELVPGELVEISAEAAEELIRQTEPGLLTFFDAKVIARTEEATASRLVEVMVQDGAVNLLTEVDPTKKTVSLRADFDGSVTPVASVGPDGTARTYTFSAGVVFEADAADVPEILALDLGDFSITNVDEAVEEAQETDLGKLRKPELIALAESLGLDTKGTNAELVERIENARRDPAPSAKTIDEHADAQGAPDVHDDEQDEQDEQADVSSPDAQDDASAADETAHDA